jgi:pimeloyl-ACP methyl ester carboxylesterase
MSRTIDASPALARPHWREHLIAANGIRQHIWRTGTGKPMLVFLPGFQEIGLTWARLAAALEHAWDCVLVDFRGQGKTELGPETYSQALLTTDVAALIRALVSEAPVAVMGFSNGAGVAAELAATHPDLVSRIVLEDPPWDRRISAAALRESPQYMAWQEQWMRWLRHFKALPAAEQPAAAAGYMPPGSAAWAPEEAAGFRQSLVELDLALLERGMALWETNDRPLPDLLPDIACPVLLLRSTVVMRPGSVAPDVAAHVARFANVRLLELPTSHFIRREAFDRVVHEVATFLDA